MIKAKLHNSTSMLVKRKKYWEGWVELTDDADPSFLKQVEVIFKIEKTPTSEQITEKENEVITNYKPDVEPEKSSYTVEEILQELKDAKLIEQDVKTWIDAKTKLKPTVVIGEKV